MKLYNILDNSLPYLSRLCLSDHDREIDVIEGNIVQKTIAVKSG